MAWRFLKKLKAVSYHPVILVLGIYPDKTLIVIIYTHSNVHSSTIYNNQDKETA